MWRACPPFKHPIVPDTHGYLAPTHGLPIANILVLTLAPYSPYSPLVTSPGYPITPQSPKSVPGACQAPQSPAPWPLVIHCTPQKDSYPVSVSQ